MLKLSDRARSAAILAHPVIAAIVVAAPLRRW